MMFLFTEYPLPVQMQSCGMRLYVLSAEKPEAISHAALLAALQRYTGKWYREDDIERLPGEKPRLRDGAVAFSVTHSGHYWMACIAPFPVGIDLQRHKEKYSLSVAKRYFHPTEMERLRIAQAEGQDNTRFFELWCARESYAKCTGCGVARLDKNYTTTASPIPLYPLPFPIETSEPQAYSLYICTDLPH